MGWDTTVVQATAVNNETRTAGEVIFEQYLAAQGLARVRERVCGQNKRPDYTVEWHGKEIILDVKDFDPPEKVWFRGGFDAHPFARRLNKVETSSKNNAAAWCVTTQVIHS